MSETLQDSQSPEERVFGRNIDPTDPSRVDKEAHERLMLERLQAIQDGKTAWLPGTNYGENGSIGYLYKNHRIVATVEIEYGSPGVLVYASMDGGGAVLAEDVSLPDAIMVAEGFAARFDS